jgi:hypothetical protein
MEGDAMRLPALALCLFILGFVPSARAEEVDLELVLAVDISYSMDLDELRLQREGYREAITSRAVLDAIRSGVHGRIALTYVEWAGSAHQSVIVDWQVIDGPESAGRFADALDRSTPERAFRTSISGALAFSADLLARSGHSGLRQVIDVSGDGANNQGPVVTSARDRVLAQGISINGLPLALKEGGAMAMRAEDLEDYYRSCVIGGPGAFVVPVRDAASFGEAVRTKLVLEISGSQPAPGLVPVQAGWVNCSMGEIMWGERYGDYGSDTP